MMKLKTIAIDDEPPALEVIKSYAAFSEYIQLEKTCTSLVEARSYLLNNNIDLVLLDINMPAMSGLDFFKSLEKKYLVIFTTAFKEFALEGFELNAVDYLLKPFKLARFEQAVLKAHHSFEWAKYKGDLNNESILLKVDYGDRKIYLRDIIYIEGLDDYVKIHTVELKIIVCRITMKNIMELLPSTHFVRIHRSYIIPYSRVKSVRNKKVLIHDLQLPIGSSYEANFMSNFKTKMV